MTTKKNSAGAQKRPAEAGGDDGNNMSNVKPGTGGDLVPINGLPVGLAASQGVAAAALVVLPVPVIDQKEDADVTTHMRSIVPYTIFLIRKMLNSREEFKSQFTDQDPRQHSHCISKRLQA